MKIKKHFGYDVIIQDGMEEMPFVTNDDIKFESKIILRVWNRQSTTPRDEKTYILKRVPHTDHLDMISMTDDYPKKEGIVTRARALNIINRNIDARIGRKSINKVEVIIQDVFRNIEKVKTYHEINKNYKHKMWIKHMKMGKPSKMESKKMHRKKSSVQKSTLKITNITGDVRKMGEQLNKNLKKLI